MRKLDGTIPEDNPEIEGVRSHVFTYGHRNMQGIAFGPDGTLYASEQGPKADDEVNILTPGGNYGWPVATFGLDYSGATISPRWPFPIGATRSMMRVSMARAFVSRLSFSCG